MLAVIIVVNLRGALKKFADVPRMWRVNRVDATVWLVTMATSALVNTELGLLVGVAASALGVLGRTQRAQVLELGLAPAQDHYEELAAYRGLQTHAGVAVFRYPAPIYYANQRLFKRSLYGGAGLDPAQEKARRLRSEKKGEGRDAGEGGAAVTLTTPPRPFHSLVIDCGAVVFLDTAGVGALKEVRRDYGEVGVRVVLARCSPPLLDDLRRGGYLPEGPGGAGLVFFSVADAVHHVQGAAVANGDYETKC